MELSGSNAVTAKYFKALNLVSASFNGQDPLFYNYDAHGNVITLTDTNYSVVKNCTYDAFGNEINPDPNDQNPFRYCGEYFDKETGDYYLRARYYDSTIGILGSISSI